MGRDLLAFSRCGKHFVHCGSDGKLKLFDTQTGILRQEFVPNLHLNSPCSSLSWVPLNSRLSPRKNRKRKLDQKLNQAIAVGTNSGHVALYSIADARVVTSLQGGHNNTPVSCVSWSDEGGLFSSANDVVVHWDLENKKCKSKWKCGKGKITSLLVSSLGDKCITASFQLKVWDVKSQLLMHTLIGHSTDVTSLVFINENYFLSAATSDRFISAWNLSGDSDEPVGRFAMNDSVNSEVTVFENEGLLQLAAVTRSGSVQLFKHLLNGKCGKPIKPCLTIEIALDKPGKASVVNLPIISSCMVSQSSLWIAYGYPPKLQFETIDVKETPRKRLTLVRPESIKPLVNNIKVGEIINENVEYVSGGVKRKGDSKIVDVPMEERLGNLSIDQVTTGSASKPSPHNMAQLLIQGLESKDKGILESVLFKRDPLVISETVSRLPLHSLGPLIRELSNLLQAKTFTSAIAAVWLKTVVATHASYLLADSQTCSILTKLESFMESRLLALPALTSLSGRLDLLLQQLEEPSQQNTINTDALLVYQDEESSDEASSFYGEIEGNESEERWEELSDQEVDIEDANMSN